MTNPCVGLCNCPLCAEDGAEVREGTKGALYIVCDNCVSQVRTMSRAGRTKIANMMRKAGITTPEVIEPVAPVEPAPPPAPKPKAKPAPEPKPVPSKPWYMT